ARPSDHGPLPPQSRSDRLGARKGRFGEPYTVVVVVEDVGVVLPADVVVVMRRNTHPAKRRMRTAQPSAQLVHLVAAVENFSHRCGHRHGRDRRAGEEGTGELSGPPTVSTRWPAGRPRHTVWPRYIVLFDE